MICNVDFKKEGKLTDLAIAATVEESLLPVCHLY
jgi:hypothetical protein